jgi:hypothetical protein
MKRTLFLLLGAAFLGLSPASSYAQCNQIISMGTATDLNVKLNPLVSNIAYINLGKIPRVCRAEVDVQCRVYKYSPSPGHSITYAQTFADLQSWSFAEGWVTRQSQQAYFNFGRMWAFEAHIKSRNLVFNISPARSEKYWRVVYNTYANSGNSVDMHVNITRANLYYGDTGIMDNCSATYQPLSCDLPMMNDSFPKIYSIPGSGPVSWVTRAQAKFQGRFRARRHLLAPKFVQVFYKLEFKNTNGVWVSSQEDTAVQSIGLPNDPSTDPQMGQVFDVNIEGFFAGGLPSDATDFRIQVTRIKPPFVTPVDGDWDVLDLRLKGVNFYGCVPFTPTPSPTATKTFTPTFTPTITHTPTPRVCSSSDPEGSAWSLVTANTGYESRIGHTTLVLNNKLWVLGGDGSRQIISSADGAAWSLVNSNPPFLDLRSQTGLVFKNEMWVMGGINGFGPNKKAWHSTDGISWGASTTDAAFGERAWPGSAVFKGKMWVIGGRAPGQYLGDVWSSSDGVAWVQTTAAAPFAPRQGALVLVSKGKLWVIGGIGQLGPLNDVWSSDDGVAWSLVTSHAGFTGRIEPIGLAYNGRLWVMTGLDGPMRNDVWYSDNGTQWFPATTNAAFPGRVGSSGAVFNGRMWVLNGAYPGGRLTDVWSTACALAPTSTPTSSPTMTATPTPTFSPTRTNSPTPSPTATLNCPAITPCALTLVTSWGSQGFGPGQFNFPEDLDELRDGTLLVANSHSNVLSRFDRQGNYLGDFGTGGGFLSNPTGMGLDATGNVYTADFSDNRIVVYSPSGNYLTQFGQYGSAAGQLYAPFDVAVDAGGNVYVAEYFNNRVQKFGPAPGFTPQWVTTYSMGFPTNIVVDQAKGVLYVAENNTGVAVLDMATGNVTYRIGDVDGCDPHLTNPHGLFLDPSGNLWVDGNGGLRRYLASTLGPGLVPRADAQVTTGGYGVVYASDGLVYQNNGWNLVNVWRPCDFRTPTFTPTATPTLSPSPTETTTFTETPTSTATDSPTTTSTPTGTFSPTTTSTPTFTLTPLPACTPGLVDGSSWIQSVPSTGYAGRFLHSSLVFNNKLWILGGNGPGTFTWEVLSSPDGSNWNREASLGAIYRHSHGSAVFNGGSGDEMRIVGGNEGHPLNDVWHSPDGVNCAQATLHAGFAARQGFGCVSFHGKLWVIAGEGIYPTFYGDIWSSANGVSWTQEAASLPFGSRSDFACWVFDDKIWIMGGIAPGGIFKNDVWWSADGLDWNQATAAAAFAPRVFSSSVVFDNKMWIIGGQSVGANYADVWSSTDGVNWAQATANAAFSPRYGHSSVSFLGRMWVLNGRTNAGNVFHPDVWTTDCGSSFAPASSDSNVSSSLVGATREHLERTWIGPSVSRGGEPFNLHLAPGLRQVEVSVYTVLGEKVAATWTKGSAGLEWNPTETASGLYLIRVRAIQPDGGTFTKTLKIVILR